MHLDEERLQRLLHGELSPSEEDAARDHLAKCGDCRQRFELLEREEESVSALFGELDRPAPRVDVAAIARRAEAGRPRLARWAAGLALVLGLAGVAYAIPGSPVRGWVAQVAEWVNGRQNPVAPTPLEEDSLAGIAVPPGESLRIDFKGSSSGGRILVSLAEGGEVQVRAPRGSATFTTGEGRLVVEDRGLGSTYDVRIPLAAPRIEIRVGEAQVFLKEGSRVTTLQSAGSGFPFLLPLSPPAP